ncbi:MAG: DUF1467 family protein [Qingshengfaniella sp.]
MSIMSAFVLFAVTWFMVSFVVLPLRLTTQGESGKVVPGTHASAPDGLRLGRKLKITTIWAVGIWAVLTVVILSELITVRDFDIMHRMPAVGAQTQP